MSNNVGAVKIVGGEGSSAHNTDGGDGGDITLVGGEAKGEGLDDNGGSIKIQGGVSFAGNGGSLELISGQSTEASSGAIKISTAPSGNKDGSSGSLTLDTGKSNHGDAEAGQTDPLVDHLVLSLDGGVRGLRSYQLSLLGKTHSILL